MTETNTSPQLKIRKRSGHLANLDISKIQTQTSSATLDLNNVSQSELELDAQIQFVDNMSTTDVANTLIQTAVTKIDIDRPDWTFVAARLFLYDLYHKVGRNLKLKKGQNPYNYFNTYIQLGIEEGKLRTGYPLSVKHDSFHADHIGCRSRYRLHDSSRARNRRYTYQHHGKRHTDERCRKP